MKFKSIIELTPLIDVFLILIFAFMINARRTAEEKQLEIELAKHESETLRLELDRKEEEIANFKENLDSSALKILIYETELAQQKQLLEKTITTTSSKLSKFFEQTAIELKEATEEGELTEEDYVNFLTKVDQLDLNQSKNIIEKIYVLGELEAYSSVIGVYLGDSNEIYLDKKSLNLSLNTFDEETGDFTEEGIEVFTSQLKEELENYFQEGKKGDKKLGEVVLITFGHSNQSMRGVIRVAENTVNEFYKELNQNEGSFRKIFYSSLGYYPFQNLQDTTQNVNQ